MLLQLYWIIQNAGQDQVCKVSSKLNPRASVTAIRARIGLIPDCSRCMPQKAHE